MTNVQVSSLEVKRGMQLDLSFSISDVVNLATTHLEAAVHQQRRETQRQLTAVDGELANLTTIIAKQTQAEADAVFAAIPEWSTTIKTLQSMLRDTVTSSVSVEEVDNDAKTLQVVGQITVGHDWRAAALQGKSQVVAMSEELCQLVIRQANLQNDRKMLVQHLRELDAALCDVPLYAAQARNELTRAILNNTAPTGKDLLQLLEEVQGASAQSLPQKPLLASK